MKQKVLLVALVVSVGLNVGAFAMLLYRRSVEGAPEREPHPLAVALDLTEDQREMMRARRERMLDEMEPLRKQLHAKRGEVLALLKEPEVDAARRDRLFAEIANLQMRLELKVFEDMRETMRMLTPEQQERFLKHLDEGFRRKHEHFARGPVHGPGGHEFGHRIIPERSGGE